MHVDSCEDVLGKGTGLGLGLPEDIILVKH